jgi:hypothetical protein
MPFETEYDATWVTLYQKKEELLDRRSALEAQLADATTQIDHLTEILSHLAPLAGIAYGEDLAALGITNAIRWILEHSEARMSPTEVRDKLEEKGFDLSSLTAPMASIYKTLSRLAEANEPDITREKEADGKVFYSWKRPNASFDQRPPAPDDYAQSAEISDDDIPF